MTSLTRILKHKAFKNLREWFKYHFPNPGFNCGNIEIIGTNGETSNYAGDIGTAFDYLFRFKLEQLNDIKEDSSPTTWVAFHALKKLPAHLKEEAEEKFKKVVFHYLELVKEDVVNDDLFEACLFLNYLDVLYRTGLIADDFGESNPDKINELKAIYENVDWEQFKTNKTCVLNPIFGGIISNVGADGDLNFEDILVDIKCTSSIKIERSYLNQLLSYYFLHLLDDSKDKQEIKKIGIYFARADYLWVMKLDDFYSFLELKKRANEFKELIVNPSLDLLPEKLEKRTVTNSLEWDAIQKNVERVLSDLNKDDK
ncbi:MAG TPA: hypothetical protein VKY45_04815 [Marinilabiliaceae bacterium]|nr:hypothetical protein [Marinilabiliaceae bacterium]